MKSIGLLVIKTIILASVIMAIVIIVFVIVHPVNIEKQMEWAIAIYQGESPLNLTPIPGVKNPVITRKNVTDVKAEYVADPFIVNTGGKWYMFFEVMNGLTNQGDIGYAESSDGLNWKYKKIILDEPFHLSYPYVFYLDGQFYMIPESAGAGEIRLYRAQDFPESWALEREIIKGAFVDNSIIFANDTWWLFACSKPRTHDELRLYYADSIHGPWLEHPLSPIIQNDATKAQLAGRIIFFGDNIIRFAQHSKKTYGKAVNAFFITGLSRTGFSEKAYEKNPVLKAKSKGWNRHGMHHIDAHEISPGKWIAAVDGYRKYLAIRIEY